FLRHDAAGDSPRGDLDVRAKRGVLGNMSAKRRKRLVRVLVWREPNTDPRDRPWNKHPHRRFGVGKAEARHRDGGLRPQAFGKGSGPDLRYAGQHSLLATQPVDIDRLSLFRAIVEPV